MLYAQFFGYAGGWTHAAGAMRTMPETPRKPFLDLVHSMVYGPGTVFPQCLPTRTKSVCEVTNLFGRALFKTNGALPVMVVGC